MKMRAFFIASVMILMFANSSYAGFVEDQLARETLKDLKTLAKELKPYDKKIGKTLIQAFRALNRGVKNDFKCSKIKGEDLLSKMEQISGIIQTRSCSNLEKRIFTPKYKHCTSAADLACVCSHKEHKKDPQCKEFLSNNDDEKKESKKQCIPDDDLPDIIDRYETIISNLQTAFLTDGDDNGVSDICEDNL